MPNQMNIERVEILKNTLAEKANFIIANYSGISVNDINALRNEMRKVNADFKVVKNNLFAIALKEKGYDESLAALLVGPSVIAFTGKDLSAPAKALKDFIKSKDTPPIQIIAGVSDGSIYQKEEVEAIASLPSREVLLAKIMGSINRPASGIVQTMNAVIATLARAIEAVAKKKNSGE
jgi:large subunit ribosomal protein L10